MNAISHWTIGCALLAVASVGTPALAARATVDMRNAQAVSIDYVRANPGQQYRLQTWYLQGENKCLEGNLPNAAGNMFTGSFQDDCQNVTGQIWKIIPDQAGYFRLQTLQSAQVDRCLEGNQIGVLSALGGVTFMDRCKAASGQLWRFVDAGRGYYHLTTQFRERDNMCLEGNKRGPKAMLLGMAHLAQCQNVSGQFWRIILGSGGHPGPQQFVPPAPQPRPQKELD
ncbi:MAG: hypothetical protein R3E48_16590 [Burkholderiaceae bacterium]